MLDLHLDIHPKTAQRLRRVLELSPDAETFAQNIITHQISDMKRAIFDLRVDLRGFEEKYQLSTEHFYRQFSQGTTDDREDYIIWAGLYEMLLKNEVRLRELE